MCPVSVSHLPCTDAAASFAGRADYFGTLPNLAARLCALANPGQILVESRSVSVPGKGGRSAKSKTGKGLRGSSREVRTLCCCWALPAAALLCCPAKGSRAAQACNSAVLLQFAAVRCCSRPSGGGVVWGCTTQHGLGIPSDSFPRWLLFLCQQQQQQQQQGSCSWG